MLDEGVLHLMDWVYKYLHTEHTSKLYHYLQARVEFK
jgi:hypothetical protein